MSEAAPYDRKQLTKFNNVLQRFLEELCVALPGCTEVCDACALVSAALSLNPGESSLLTKYCEYMSSAKGAIENKNLEELLLDIGVKSSRNGGGGAKRVEGVLAHVAALGEEDRRVCWKYITKLHSMASKMRPDINRVDVSRIVASSRQHAAVGENDSLIQVALDALLGQYQAITGRTDILSMSSEAMMGAFCPSPGVPVGDYAQALMMGTQDALATHGPPFSSGPSEGVAQADYESVCMQLGTMVTTLCTLDPGTLKTVEKIAGKVLKQIGDGEVSLDGSLDTMSVLQMLTESGAAEELFALL